MKISHWFLIFLLGFGIVVLLLIAMDQPLNSTGGIHEQYKTMAHSGQSVVVTSHSKWLAYFFGIGVIGVLGFTVSFGAKRKGKFEGIKSWLVIGQVAYLIMFSLMTFVYWDYSSKGDAIYFGGYPLPTAIMLYGMSTIPIILTIVYYIKFNSWVLTEEDEKRFQEIVKSRKLRNQ